ASTDSRGSGLRRWWTPSGRSPRCGSCGCRDRGRRRGRSAGSTRDASDPAVSCGVGAGSFPKAGIHLRNRAPMIAPLHTRHRRLRGALGGDEVVDARAQVLENEILLGRRLAVVDFLGPLLERKLDAERLVDGEGDVQKVEAIDAEIVDGVTFR